MDTTLGAMNMAKAEEQSTAKVRVCTSTGLRKRGPMLTIVNTAAPKRKQDKEVMELAVPKIHNAIPKTVP
jgi:hypothetical protein